MQAFWVLCPGIPVVIQPGAPMLPPQLAKQLLMSGLFGSMGMLGLAATAVAAGGGAGHAEEALTRLAIFLRRADAGAGNLPDLFLPQDTASTGTRRILLAAAVAGGGNAEARGTVDP